MAAGLPFKDAGTPAGQSSRDVAASQALQPLPGQMERSSPGPSPTARAASSSPGSTPFSAGAPSQEEEALGPAAEEEGPEQVTQALHAAVEHKWTAIRREAARRGAHAFKFCFFGQNRCGKAAELRNDTALCGLPAACSRSTTAVIPCRVMQGALKGRSALSQVELGSCNSQGYTTRTSWQ